MSAWLYVFIGGGLGSMARYGVSVAASSLPTNFPYPTLISNVCASLLLGIFASYIIEQEQSWLRLLLIVGFCGGFSTFSSFSFETFELLKSGAITEACLNMLGNTLLCLSAIGIGLFLGKNL